MSSIDSNEQVASEISQRIQALETLMGEDLRNEMTALKQAIMENPSACALLKPEDSGKLVEALRKIVGIAVASAAAKKTPAKEKAAKAAPVKLTAEELQQALDDM